MTKEEVLKLALEALEEINKLSIGENAICLPAEIDTAMDAIKEALAQPEQEPVTWRYKIVDVFGRPAWTLKTPKSDTRVLESQPLYTTPPQRKPLTDEEIRDLWSWSATAEAERTATTQQHAFARAIEAAHGIKEQL